MPIWPLCLAASLALAPAAGAAPPTSFPNPVLPGFHPDPSVTRVGDDYYLVTSSFEWFPALPLFHSKDLVHWRPIGHVVDRPGQIDLSAPSRFGGIYAPTIRHHDGTFYVAVANVVKSGGILLFRSSAPEGPWSDPVQVRPGGIDPDLFFDEDGQVYLTTTAPSGQHPPGVYQSRIDPRTGKELGAPRMVWSGLTAKYPEGPHLYRAGGWYHLVIAEGGSEYGHMVTVARSRSPSGPFEPHPRNPVFTHRDTDYRTPVQAVGHVDLVQGSNGTWWALFLAIRPVGHYPFFRPLGRETFLAPVRWSADGWPVINDGRPVGLEMPTAGLPGWHPWPPDPTHALDPFDGTTLGPRWISFRSRTEGDVSLAARPGFLRLSGSAVPLSGPGAPTLVARRQEDFSFEALARMEFTPRRAADEAGLTVFMDPSHHHDLFVRGGASGRELALRHRLAGIEQVIPIGRLPRGEVRLAVTATEHAYEFSATVGDRRIAAGRVDRKFLSPEVAGGFTGATVGLFASGNGSRSTAPADFASFEYRRR